MMTKPVYIVEGYEIEADNIYAICDDFNTALSILDEVMKAELNKFGYLMFKNYVIGKRKLNTIEKKSEEIYKVRLKKHDIWRIQLCR